jgi:hypothetical protein
MKKSEAVLKISSNLWGKNIPTNSKDLAELVIILAEELGMAPPVNHNMSQHEWRDKGMNEREWERE